MKEVKEKLKLTVPPGIVHEPIIHKLSTKMSVIPNILRGRITPKSARIELELSGAKGSIAKAKKYLKAIGVKIKKA